MDHLNRYFCEAGKADKVYRDHKGLIYRIDASELPFFEQENTLVIPRQWDHYSTYRSIVLLGPPRQGKTIEFKYQCSRSTNGFFLPLRDLSDPNDSRPDFFQSP